MKRLSALDWKQQTIIWFLELSYNGQTLRFATLTMHLTDGDGKSYLYTGGLEDVGITQRMGTVGQISTQSDSISMALTMPNRNISKELWIVNVLDGN